MDINTKINVLKSKAEALSLTCNLANIYWSRIKLIFNIPLILTSSVMALLNSITTDANEVKLPNIIVNSVSVLIISLNNSIKASEKADNFKKLSQQFLLLVSEIDNRENDDDIHLYNLKYDGFINDIAFEDITTGIKNQVNMLFDDEELPLQIKVINMKKRIKTPSLSSSTPSVDLCNINRV